MVPGCSKRQDGQTEAPRQIETVSRPTFPSYTSRLRRIACLVSQVHNTSERVVMALTQRYFSFSGGVAAVIFCSLLPITLVVLGRAAFRPAKHRPTPRILALFRHQLLRGYLQGLCTVCRVLFVINTTTSRLATVRGYYFLEGRRGK